MAMLTCKMCGGTLVPTEDSNICECEFCGTKQTIPTADSDKKTTLFNRANRLRMNAEFDKAAAIYESIVAEFPNEAEAYWGLCLCAYGIEYVDDPVTGEKKPTCHRTLPVSIMEDSNFEQACDNADLVARRLYREEAKAIDRIQKDILAIVSSEKPYDVFICYKETDENGGRTEDSVLAQEIYDSLTAKDLKVFFSRITLEDKLGQQYEPYIYAALVSAKVLIAVGTKFEYYDAVWVKNEWMRFLSMMHTDRTKTLIPCYKGLDAYDMPKEFRQMQAQDMDKLGWLQDLTRGVMKLCGKEKGTPVATPIVQQIVTSGNPTVDSLLQRARLFLEDGKWEEADQYADRVLDIEPMNAEGYLLKLMIELKVNREEKLAEQEEPFSANDNYQKAVRFAEEGRKQQIADLNQAIETRIRQKNEAAVLAKASTVLKAAESVEECQEAQKQLRSIAGFPGASELIADCAAKMDAIQAVSQKVASLESELKKQWDQYQPAASKAAAINRRVQDAERKKVKILASLKDAETELSNLRGLFTGKRRAELESVIADRRKELADSETELAKEQSAYRAAQREVPDRPNEEETKYTIANLYIQVGLYRKAFKTYRQITGYKDVNSLLKTNQNLVAVAEAAAARDAKCSVGKHVTFGHYPQTSDGNDSTPIEWLVLARIGQSALLLSRYGLDGKPYNDKPVHITWEKCTLRTWLNVTFLNAAFSAQEQTCILTTRVDNSKRQGYSVYNANGGNNTQDKIFLLSYTQANKYLNFSSKDLNGTESRVAPTAYALKQGVKTNDDKTADGTATANWWLRSPGFDQKDAALVLTDGSLDYCSVSTGSGCVRPALWINLESDIF